MKNFIPEENTMRLETGRLVLEPIKLIHAAELVELFSDAELHQFVPFEPPTLEQQEKRCSLWASKISPDQSELWLNWAARDRQSQKLIGHFQAGLKADLIATVGYVVARSFQGKGIAKEGMVAVFEFLREVLHVREIKAWSDTRNKASHHLARSLGMTQVGLIKSADYFKGSSSDEFVFSKVYEKGL